MSWAARVRRLMFASHVALATLFAAPACCIAQEHDLANPEQAIQSGADALGGGYGRVWYDSQNDSLKPLKLRPLPQRSEFWESVEEFFEWLFGNWNLNLSDVLVFLGWLVIAGLVAWIAIALILAYQRAELRMAEADDEANERAAIARVEALPIALENRVEDLLAEAKRLYGEGDLARAIVYLFSHELVELDRCGLLRLVKGKTNRQYLRELKRSAQDRSRVSEIVERTMLMFEAAFFGAHPPQRPEFEVAWREANEFASLLTPTAGAML